MSDNPSMDGPQPLTVAHNGCRTRPHWFGPPGRPLLGWLTSPVENASDAVVLLVPPLGYEYWTTHRTLRTLAEQLAGMGVHAMRVDLDGTGDSAGGAWDSDRVSSWQESVVVAAAELRRLGFSRLGLFGVRLGGTIALLQAGRLNATAAAAWSPVASGRRHARQLRMLSEAVPEGRAPDGTDGAMVSAGTVFSAQTMQDLATLDLTKGVHDTAPQVLLIGDAPDAKIATHLGSLGASVSTETIAADSMALETSTEAAQVPHELTRAVASWFAGRLLEGKPAELARLETLCSRVTISLSDSEVEEAVVSVGDNRLIGVETRPTHDSASRGPTVVFLNSGSEPHIGPGRAWVEYARQLALHGYTSLRVDYRGWGESPDEDRAPGRPYDPHTEDDTADIVNAARESNPEGVVLVGLCAAAWVAMRVALKQPLDGIIALNPQFYWRHGEPLDPTIEQTLNRRAPVRVREARGNRLRVWSSLDLLGIRTWAGRWIDELARSRTPILLLFAEGDEGLVFLRNRLERRLKNLLRSGEVRLVEVPDIDHAMHRAWLRDSVVAAILDELPRFRARVGAGPGA